LRPAISLLEARAQTSSKIASLPSRHLLHLLDESLQARWCFMEVPRVRIAQGMYRRKGKSGLVIVLQMNSITQECLSTSREVIPFDVIGGLAHELMRFVFQRLATVQASAAEAFNVLLTQLTPLIRT